MIQASQEDEMTKLFEGLIHVMKQTKRIKEENIPSEVIFRVYNMTKNRMSQTLSESSIWISSEVADSLLEQGMIQKVLSGDHDKYALTFKGMARCIKREYGIDLQDQFSTFLELSDQKFNTTEQSRLTWKEKLALLALVLLASTSPSSAIRLDNETNQTVLTEVFQKALNCLKKYGLVEKKAEIRTVSRGENPVSALMSRLNALPRKTNHYYKYVGRGSEYYLDIERDGQVNQRRTSFLLTRIFEKYNPNSDYNEIFRELSEIGQLYYTRFRGRSVDAGIVLAILAELKDFVSKKILHLPVQIDHL